MGNVDKGLNYTLNHYCRLNINKALKNYNAESNHWVRRDLGEETLSIPAGNSQSRSIL